MGAWTTGGGQQLFKQNFLQRWKTFHSLREAIKSGKSNCWVLTLVRRCVWNLLLRKRQWKDCHRQFGPLWSYENRRCHMPHNSSEYSFIAKHIFWRYQLAVKIMRFDAIRLFLWGYAKDRVCADKSSTLGVPPNIYLKVVENWNTSHEGHLNDVVFYTLNVNVQTFQ